MNPPVIDGLAYFVPTEPYKNYWSTNTTLDPVRICAVLIMYALIHICYLAVNMCPI